MDRGEAAALREMLALTGTPTGWIEETAQFGSVLRRAPRRPGGLLLAGPRDAEPWHMAAHLGDESRLCGLEQLTPVLVRHKPEVGAPSHLAAGLERLAEAGRGEALLVVAGWDPDETLLERVGDARRRGVRILALEQDAAELRGLAHDALTVPPEPVEPEPVPNPGLDLGPGPGLSLRPGPSLGPGPGLGPGLGLGPGAVDLDCAQHLVSLAAGSPEERGARRRLGRWLDAVSGPRVESW